MIPIPIFVQLIVAATAFVAGKELLED